MLGKGRVGSNYKRQKENERLSRKKLNILESQTDSNVGSGAPNSKRAAQSQGHSSIQQAQIDRESSAKSSIRLQYLRRMKDRNKTSRFNEDLASEYSRALSGKNGGVQALRSRIVKNLEARGSAASNGSQGGPSGIRSNKEILSKLSKSSKGLSLTKRQRDQLSKATTKRSSQVATSAAGLQTGPQQMDEEEMIRF